MLKRTSAAPRAGNRERSLTEGVGMTGSVAEPSLAMDSSCDQVHSRP